MKNLVVLFFAAVLVLSCAKDEIALENETTEGKRVAERLDQGNNVKLFKAWIGTGGRRGAYSEERVVEVEVRNIAYDKEVKLVHEMDNGTWQEFPLTYKMSTPDNTEIWTTGEISLTNGYPYNMDTAVQFGDQFAIKYVVDGQEYWDNNNWENYYTGEVEGGNQYGTMLREGINLSVNELSSYYSVYNGNGSLSIQVDVQNIGYEKEVELVYTTDGWATYSVVPLAYSNSYWVGEYNYQSGANAYGVERWSTPYVNLENAPDSIEYAVVYKVNGQEYWDNNFGENYVITAQVY